MECTPTRFIDNSQVVRETVDRPEGKRQLVRMGLQRLKKRTDRNHMKFNKGKFLHLGHDKPT